MKTQRLYFTIFLLVVYMSTNAQQITPLRGNSTVCPGERIPYTVGGTVSCGQGEDKSYVWTVTNGTFTFDQNVTSKTTTTNNVDVWWNDTTSDGVLSVSVKCGNDIEETVSASYAIRSLAGRIPDNARASFTLPYCSTAGNTLLVDQMTLFNTGGTTGIQLQYADGYEWELPSGWTSGGSGGIIRTSANIINIATSSGCSGGTATVRAYVDCVSGRKYSNKANISLARPQPNISISLPSGYSGPSCGDIQPRTFTVSSVSCASSYSWIFPSGWSHSSFVTTTNSITVTPSGGASDGGLIQVNVNLSCGTVFPASKQLNASKPQISAPSVICNSVSNVSLTNLAGGISVNWSVSSNLSIVSGQGTPNVSVKAINSLVRGEGTISATVSCPGISVDPKSVWVGKPSGVITNPSGVPAIEAKVNNWVVLWATSTPGATIASLNWWTNNEVALNLNVGQGNCSVECLQTGYNYVYVTSNNVCGTSLARQVPINVTSGSVNCGVYPYPPCLPMIVFPNPASTYLEVDPQLTQEEYEKGYEARLYSSNQKNLVYHITSKEPSIRIETVNMKKGIYILEIITTKQIITDRIFIE